MANGKKSKVPELQLAYHNRKFLESPDARALRIISEYIEPQVHFQKAGAVDTVVFFGSARILPRNVAVRHLRDVEHRHKNGSKADLRAALKRARMDVHMSRYYEAARKLAAMITEWAKKTNKPSRSLLVCSGGGPGIMEAANRGASEAGGKSVGLNIKLPMEQTPNPYISPELSMLFRYFFMRKLWFAQPAQALIVFPGGFGTFDEMFELLTLIQTRKMSRPVTILLYGSKYWKRVIDFGYLVEAGTISSEDLKLIRFVDSPQQAFDLLKDELGQRLGLLPAVKHPFV